MILIKRHRKTRWFVLSAVALLLISAFYEIKRTDLFLKDPLYELMELDPGYSSVKNILLTFQELSFSGKVAKVAETISQNIQRFPQRPPIERLDLDIEFLALQKILDDRRRAIANDFLTNPTTVKAKIRFHNKTYKAKIRLKGDLGDHWYSKSRLSFRVSLKGKNSILGFKKFSIQKPRARQHPYDQTFQALLQKSGNITAAHTYANVYVNGKYWGVMNIEEHISKELLEKQKRKESIVVRLGNDKAFEVGNTLNFQKPNGYKLSDERLNIKLYGENKYLKKHLHRQWLTYISQSLLDQQSTSYLDTDSFSRALLAASLWNNPHTLSPLNSRYYFNPYSLRLEPITTDQGRIKPLNLENSENNAFPIATSFFTLFNQVAKSKEFKEKLDTNLASVTRIFQNTQQTLDHYQRFFPLDKHLSAEAIISNIKATNSHTFTTIPVQISKLDKQKETSISPEVAKNLPIHLHAKHYDNGQIDVFNLLPYSVKLLRIDISGDNILKEPVIIEPYDEYSPTTISTNLKGIQDGKISLETEFMGSIRRTKLPASLVNDKHYNPLLFSTPSHPFLKKIDQDSWEIRPGKWIIDKPLVIQGDLKISGNTQLLFSTDAYLLVKGALNAIGTKENITLTALEHTWKGVYVFEAHQMSSLTGVRISKTTAFNDSLLSLSGGVTFYKSDVTMRGVIFNGSQAEDALNIVSSKFSLTNITISNSISDGFDSDFSTGEIKTSLFNNISGDAVDFSGSNVHITGLVAKNIHDKTVSAGEASTITIENSTITNTGVGIASKDGSNVKCSNTTIKDYQLYAAMTYVKKDFYGSPQLLSQRCGPSLITAYSRQKGSLLSVDNLSISETKLDVKDLYQNEIMKK